MFRPGLRSKLALAALVLAALPWVGWLYVQEMERFLVAAQEQNLMGTARAVATALHDRPLPNAGIAPGIELRPPPGERPLPQAPAGGEPDGDPRPAMGQDAGGDASLSPSSDSGVDRATLDQLGPAPAGAPPPAPAIEPPPAPAGSGAAGRARE
ncbi:MAG: hypothetical protein IT514_11595, partial [Burkholderiales bacterium]|nr:hypothetical protein [Burkholderiales bacterium]